MLVEVEPTNKKFQMYVIIIGTGIPPIPFALYMFYFHISREFPLSLLKMKRGKFLALIICNIWRKSEKASSNREVRTKLH